MIFLSSSVADTSTMAPKPLKGPTPLKLDDYNLILVAHEQEFRDAKGADRMEVVADIQQEIVALHEGDLDDPTTKGLGKVSDWYQLRPSKI